MTFTAFNEREETRPSPGSGQKSPFLGLSWLWKSSQGAAPTLGALLPSLLPTTVWRLEVVFISVILVAEEGGGSDSLALVGGSLWGERARHQVRTRGVSRGRLVGKTSKLILKGVQRGLGTPFHRTAQKLFKWNSLQLLQ